MQADQLMLLAATGALLGAASLLVAVVGGSLLLRHTFATLD